MFVYGFNGAFIGTSLPKNVLVPATGFNTYYNTYAAAISVSIISGKNDCYNSYILKRKRRKGL